MVDSIPQHLTHNPAGERGCRNHWPQPHPRARRLAVRPAGSSPAAGGHSRTLNMPNDDPPLPAAYVPERTHECQETSSLNHTPIVHSGHKKANGHPYHQHTKPKSHHPDLRREWRAASQHVYAQPYRRQCPTPCLSSYGAYRHGDGVRHAVVELEALRGRTLTSEGRGLPQPSGLLPGSRPRWIPPSCPETPHRLCGARERVGADAPR